MEHQAPHRVYRFRCRGCAGRRGRHVRGGGRCRGRRRGCDRCGGLGCCGWSGRHARLSGGCGRRGRSGL
ncbi:MAG: hypothetical protein D6721_04160 [Gammaproteobacteria bacterium]|nr:MAG: hypothetical protein D6721_04160 [Gammaproteobacteria bacterium]